MKMENRNRLKLTASQQAMLSKIAIGLQRMRRDPQFLALARGFGLTLREIVWLAWYAGRL